MLVSGASLLRVLPVGADAALVEVPDTESAQSLAAWARQGGELATDVVAGAATVLFDGLPGGVPELRRRLTGWRPGLVPAPDRVVVVRVVYDGPDLADVADRWGVTPDEAVERHTGVEFRSAFCGFAPGFSYLSGLPAIWAVPRLESPRSRVPAGSVALADSWCGVYPTASPGGWRLLGRTDADLWDAERDPPALLAPGTRIRFEAVG